MAENKNSLVQSVLVVVSAVAIGWYYFGGGLEKQAANNMQKIEQQVAGDSVEQYVIAKRNGSAMDACAHAGLVSAAYLQAKDETHYQQWEKIERADCARAGVPR
jgi:hypothetical protein